ncbi:MAG TPA: hypothetical protein VGM90_30795 [Kofleriaceae bacterium]|jgi:hypothetical protein
MAKFEYDVYTVSWGHGAATTTIVEELNKRGEDGWELVGTTRDESPDDKHDEEVVMFVFKRAKRKDKAAKKQKKLAKKEQKKAKKASKTPKSAPEE